MRHTLISILLITLVAIQQVSANDTAATLGAGGLVTQKTTQIAMESEQLEITVHKITIRYLFRNTADADLDLLIAFPLPDLNGGLLYNSPVNLPNEKAVNFVDFSVTANGKPVQTAMEVRAFDGNKDITARLKSAGLSGNVLLSALNKEMVKVPDAERKRLEKEELIMADDFNPPLPGIGKRGWWATWTMRVNFYWKQRFPANGTIELVQTYRPVVGGSYIMPDDDGKWSIDRYCGTSKTLQRIAEVKKRHPVSKDETALLERTIDYNLTTANNWKGPIGRFQLAVSTYTPDDILATCMPGLRQLNGTRYELEKTNFSPSSDLKLLILQPAKAR